MLLQDNTYKVQQSLANYCRDGEEVEIPGAIQDRLSTYRRLVFNVASDTIKTAFPISTKYIDSKIIDEMIFEFFKQHDNTSPLLWKMPLAFYQFCINEEYATQYNLPYLNDLLWFECLEIEIFMMEDESYPLVRNEGDFFNDILALNPEHRLEKLNYPVHLKDPDRAVNEKGDYFLLLYREKESGKVQFMNLSILFAYVLERLSKESISLNDMLDDILYIFGINDLNLLKSNLESFISDLRTKGFVIGYQL